MAIIISMPKLGLTMTEGLVAKWYKKEGDTVKSGDALFEVETDKLTNQVEADCEGILLKIVADEGDTVPCTQPVAYIGKAGETITDRAAPTLTPMAAAQREEAPAAARTAQKAGVDPKYILASPAAKHLAAQRGISLHAIAASGPNGSVILSDVEAYEAMPGAKASGLAAKIAKELDMDLSSIAAEGRVMGADVLRAAVVREQGGMQADDTSIPLNGMRKTIARRMKESWSISPRVCFEMEVDCTNMIALRKQLKKPFEQQGLKLNYNHILMLSAARALIEYPDVNASLDGDTLIRHGAINIGLAVGMENGLLVPNLKHCERLGLLGIAAGTEDMITRAREGKLSMDELGGGTFTITNLGMYGMRSFSPIINQPELAILGVNAIIDTPIAIDGQIVVRPVMNLNLVADHRAIDGVKAAKFLHRIVELLETPALLLM